MIGAVNFDFFMVPLLLCNLRVLLFDEFSTFQLLQLIDFVFFSITKYYLPIAKTPFFFIKKAFLL